MSGNEMVGQERPPRFVFGVAGAHWTLRPAAAISGDAIDGHEPPHARAGANRTRSCRHFAVPSLRRPASMTRTSATPAMRPYGVELTPENGPQSLVGGAAVPMVVLSEGEFSKSNMSSRVSAN